MKKENNKRGITLIALVITVIVLLILATVALNMALNDGILGKTRQATEAHRGSVVYETAEIWKYEIAMAHAFGQEVLLEEALDAILLKLTHEGILTSEEILLIKNEENTNHEITIGGILISFKIDGAPGTPGGSTIADMFDETGEILGKVHVGDYVLYSPDGAGSSYSIDGSKSTSSPGNGTANQLHTRESLDWRVLDIKGGQVRLISAEPTSFDLTLQGANGYNNAVKLIDEACSIYGGTKGTAQGLKIEDIEKHTLYDYESFPNYGSPDTPSNTNYPSIFAFEQKQLGNGETGLRLSEQSGGTGGWFYGLGPSVGTLDTTQTHWWTIYSSESASTEWEDSMYYTLFIDNGSIYPKYWMSSRCVNLVTGYAATFRGTMGGV